MQAASNNIGYPRGEHILALIGDAMTRTLGDAFSASTINTDDILAAASGAIAERLPVTCMAILMKSDPDTSRVVFADRTNPEVARWLEQYIATFRPNEVPTMGLSRRVIESGGPVLVPRMKVDKLMSMASEWAQRYMAEHPIPLPGDEVGFLMVPMRSGPAVVGTLAIFDWDCQQLLGDADLDWMQRAADRIGITVDYAQTRNKAIQRSERIAALSDVALAITSSQDHRLTFKLILERVMASLHVNAADVLLVDDSEGYVFVAAGSGFRSGLGSEVRGQLPTEAGKRWLIEHNVAAPNVVDWIPQARRWMLAREGLKSYTAAPLVVREKFVGALEVFSRAEIEPDPEALAFLDAMASQAAIALDNSNMLEALRRGGQARPVHRGPAPSMSERELQILRLIVDGASNREVAEKLHLSQNTIKFHVRQLLEKAEVANRTELATKALHKGWL